MAKKKTIDERCIDKLEDLDEDSDAFITINTVVKGERRNALIRKRAKDLGLNNAQTLEKRIEIFDEARRQVAEEQGW